MKNSCSRLRLPQAAPFCSTPRLAALAGPNANRLVAGKGAAPKWADAGPTVLGKVPWRRMATDASSIAKGRAITQVARRRRVCFALDAVKGTKQVWETKVAPEYKNSWRRPARTRPP